MNNKSRFKVIFFSASPFILFGLYNYLTSPFFMDDQSFLKFVAIIFVSAMTLIVLAQKLLKDGHYFPPTVLGVFCLLALTLHVIPENNYNQIMSENGLLNILFARPQLALYSGMFIMSFCLPLFKIRPFTEYFAKRMTPEAFWNTELFKRVNLYINYFWSFLFVLSIGSQFFPHMSLQIAVPLALQFLIGLPATKIMIPLLQEKFAHVQNNQPKDYIKRAYDAVSGMPFVFNKKEAAGIDLVFQFAITGEEEFKGYLTVKDGKCLYKDGSHEKPDLTIKSPSGIWLRISRGELSGQAAFIKKLFTVEGDQSKMMIFSKIFGNAAKPEKTENIVTLNNRGTVFEKKYESLEPGSIKKVLVIQGSPRKPGTSKTDILSSAFAEGCAAAGAEVETIYLRNKKINQCTGCYTCWTKSPGTCVFRDDMPELLEKQEAADLVVYASPLYHFGIISLMKKYMERTLPLIEPYLIRGRNGETTHPPRGNHKSANAVIISVCGFPEISHFDAFSLNYHLLARAGGIKIISEIYRPASESLSALYYKSEKDRVVDAVKKAGMDIVLKGAIEQKLVDSIAEVQIDKNEFMEAANMTWDHCIAVGKTLPEIQEEEIIHAGIK